MRKGKDPETEPDPVIVTEEPGYGSERPKNIRILQIWIRNTAINSVL
jgi:hypothetical protein